MGIEIPPESAHDLPAQLTLLKERFPKDTCEAFLLLGDAVAVVAPGALREVMQFLNADKRLRFNVLLDLTAVDYLGREPRFEVVYQLLSSSHNLRLRIKVSLPGEKPAVDSMTGLWESANWLEREVWDMFGIEFLGHPNLERILLYPEFQGHPLRKDYPIRKRQPLVGPKN
ncbi:MAG: NADH-quinone oxidoreductase subunit C [Acidobacteriota bacterium]|jgi:NADH-quinone oxidoreductase subunit C